MTGNGTVPFVNIEQLQRGFATLWKTREFTPDARPIAAGVLGSVGSGKTSGCSQFIDALNASGTKTAVVDMKKVQAKVDEATAAGNGYDLWKIIVSVLTSSDFGVPYPTADGKLEHLAPTFLPFDSEEKGVLLFDEFDRGKPDVQNSALQILLGGELHGHKVSPNVFIVLTMNGSSDIYTTPLSEAARTRICSLFVSARAPGASDSWQGWAKENGISPLMRGFAKFKPDMIEAKEDFEELAIATPRSRDMADFILRAAESVKFETDDILLPLLAGVIGKANASELIAYRTLFRECPDPDEVIRHPETTPVPEKQSILYALGIALLDRVSREDRDAAVAVTKYATRMPEEKAAFILRQLADVCPAVIGSKEYIKWTRDHKMLIV